MENGQSPNEWIENRQSCATCHTEENAGNGSSGITTIIFSLRYRGLESRLPINIELITMEGDTFHG